MPQQYLTSAKQCDFPKRVRRRPWTSFAVDFFANEDGKISVSALIVMVAFVVLFGFLGNAGQAVFRKMEMQNAADSMAHSANVWRARHMNTLTVKNQLMGELTALAVFIEALGGSKEDQVRRKGPESDKVNQTIRGHMNGNFSVVAISPGNLAAIALPALRRSEVEYLKFIGKVMTADKGQHDCWATVYDGKVNIKRWVDFGIRLKSVIFIAEGAVTVASTVVGGISKLPFDQVALAGHLLVDLAFVELVKDWYLAEGVELLVKVLGPLRDPVLPAAITGVSLYGDYVASPLTLRENIRKTLDRSAQQFAIGSYATFPLMRDISLPVEREKPPERLKGSDKPQIPFSASAKKPEKRGMMAAIQRKVGVMINPIRASINLLIDVWNAIPFNKDVDRIPAISAANDPPASGKKDGGGFGFKGNHSLNGLRNYTERARMDCEAEKQSEWVRATYPHVDHLRQPVAAFFRRYVPTSAMDAYYVHWTNRYTLSVSHRLRSGIVGGSNQKQPIVDRLRELRRRLDALRRRYRNFVNDTAAANSVEVEAVLSDMSAELQALAQQVTGLNNLNTRLPLDEWLDLVKKHVELAKDIGREAEAESENDLEEADFQKITQSIAWIDYLGYLLDALDTLLQRIEALLDTGPPHMHVIKDSTPDNKGHEPWTSDSAAAQKLFAIQVYAQREIPAAILTPPLYPNPNRKGLVVVAESMLYNANGRNGETSASTTESPYQPDTGWDLLNWKRPVKALEWGGEESDGAGAGDLFRMLSAGLPIGEQNRNAALQNWQSKLSPISPSRVNAAMYAPEIQKLMGQQNSSTPGLDADALLH